jgi:hypothetical protein
LEEIGGHFFFLKIKNTVSIFNKNLFLIFDVEKNRKIQVAAHAYDFLFCFVLMFEIRNAPKNNEEEIIKVFDFFNENNIFSFGEKTKKIKFGKK